MNKRYLYFLIITFYFLAGNNLFSQQSQSLESLRSSLKKATADTQKVNIILQIIEEEGDDEAISKYNKEALEIVNKNELSQNALIKKTAKRQKAGVLINIAYIFQLHSQYDSAVAIYNDVIKTAEEINNESIKFSAYNNLGGIYHMQGNFLPALKNYSEALTLMEKQKDFLSVATVLNNIANIHMLQKDYTNATDYYLKSLKIRKELHHDNDVAQCYSNLGSVFISRGLIDSALYYYKLGISYLRPDVTYGIPAAIYSGMSTIYINKGDFNNGLLYIRRSYNIRIQTKIPYQLAKANSEMGDFYLRALKRDSALFYLEKAHAIAKELNAHDVMKNTSSNLFPIYANKKMYEKAFYALDEFKKLSDKQLNSETQKAAVQQSLKYEFEKKEMLAKAEQEKKDEINLEKDKRQQILIFAVCGILILVLGFAINIYRNFLQKQKANISLQEKNQIIEEKQKEILDSIKYAKRIQTALLPKEKYIERVLNEREK